MHIIKNQKAWLFYVSSKYLLNWPLNSKSLQTLVNNFCTRQYRDISTTAPENILIEFWNRWLLHSVLRWLFSRKETQISREMPLSVRFPSTQVRNELYINDSFRSRFTASWKHSWVHRFFFFIIIFAALVRVIYWSVGVFAFFSLKTS